MRMEFLGTYCILQGISKKSKKNLTNSLVIKSYIHQLSVALMLR